MFRCNRFESCFIFLFPYSRKTCEYPVWKGLVVGLLYTLKANTNKYITTETASKFFIICTGTCFLLQSYIINYIQVQLSRLLYRTRSYKCQNLEHSLLRKHLISTLHLEQLALLLLIQLLCSKRHCFPALVWFTAELFRHCTIKLIFFPLTRKVNGRRTENKALEDVMLKILNYGSL